MNVLYLRHGQTDGNLQNICVGQMDMPLNAKGLVQAERAAQSSRLAEIRSIVASPLIRARQTAKAVSVATGLTVAFHDGLKEVCMGSWEGLPEDDPGMYARWIAGETPEGAESWVGFSTRVRQAVTEILQKQDGPLIVAHCAVLWAIRDSLGLPADSELGNGEYITLDIPADYP